ncbi:MAG: universal stress protein [Lactobacillaceae bacterium]|jgi:nucleotide-binding universal stress UspA family protein|nr:universal stress protein [Lactobacillaceae bacterium]
MVKIKQFKKVLVAVDESEQGQFALENAIHQSLEDESSLIIVSIFEPNKLSTIDLLDNKTVKELQQKIEENLELWAEKAKKAGVKNVKTIYSEGNPGEVIVKDVIPQTGANLVVVGAHSKAGLSQHYFGSQASYIANRASISVLVVRK